MIPTTATMKPQPQLNPGVALTAEPLKSLLTKFNLFVPTGFKHCTPPSTIVTLCLISFLFPSTVFPPLVVRTGTSICTVEFVYHSVKIGVTPYFTCSSVMLVFDFGMKDWKMGKMAYEVSATVGWQTGWLELSKRGREDTGLTTVS